MEIHAQYIYASVAVVLMSCGIIIMCEEKEEKKKVNKYIDRSVHYSYINTTPLHVGE